MQFRQRWSSQSRPHVPHTIPSTSNIPRLHYLPLDVSNKQLEERFASTVISAALPCRVHICKGRMCPKQYLAVAFALKPTGAMFGNDGSSRIQAVGHLIASVACTHVICIIVCCPISNRVRQICTVFCSWIQIACATCSLEQSSML